MFDFGDRRSGVKAGEAGRRSTSAGVELGASAVGAVRSVGLDVFAARPRVA